MSQHLLETRALRKEYFDVLAVDDLDWAVAPGEIHGLIGPNGAGKTTLLRMLATTLEPTSGQVLFEGKSLWRDPTRLRGQMGFMPDFFQMYGRLTVTELLRYFGIAHGLDDTAIDERVRAVLAQTELTDKADAFCRGLSRGMVQRLGLARAILHRPTLLLLDEPASGLDPMARQVLFDILRGIHASGTTIIISSHILAELSGLCTAVAIMHEGRFLATGKTDEIIRQIMPKRRIRLHVTAAAANATAILSADTAVTDLGGEAPALEFAFDGDDDALADLNARLVTAGVGVARLEEGRASLHELYFAITERNTHAATAPQSADLS